MFNYLNWRWGWSFIGVALIFVLVYAVFLLIQAYRITPVVIEKAHLMQETGLQIANLSNEWKHILLTVEDPGFYQHNGVDLSTPGAGLTTITQALVKLYYFDNFMPGPHAKLKQSLYAMVLDSQMEKDLQLTLFLNSASFGPTSEEWVIGFPKAAQVYFDKSFAELTRLEFITLVSMLVGPATFHPKRNPDKLAERVARVEALLAGQCKATELRDVYYRTCLQ
ncbi:transglycosylase domain-containing protein [Chloroflexi bacterium TSY]|nr:transglycosylase domain-containing protein [Chloroflexi bacterium TSY]